MRKLKAQKYAALMPQALQEITYRYFLHRLWTDMGTGIVMSVPAHAPFDYCALKDLAAGNGAFAAKASAIKPIEIYRMEFQQIHSKIEGS